VNSPRLTSSPSGHISPLSQSLHSREARSPLHLSSFPLVAGVDFHPHGTNGSGGERQDLRGSRPSYPKPKVHQPKACCESLG